MRCLVPIRALAAGILCAAVAIASPGPAAAAEPASFPMGMNLAGVADWSSEIIFVDAFKVSRPWISQKEGAQFGMGGDLATNERGWVTKLNDQQFAEALIHMDIGNHYPGGKYVCLFDGEGELEFSNAAQGRLSGKNKYDVTVDRPRFGARAGRPTEESDQEHPTGEGGIWERTYQTAPLSEEFLDRYRGFQVIRFMDWLRTNNSKLEKWADRPKPDDATQAGEKGVALEFCIKLANTLNADPWLCLPHKADDDYVRQFAALVKKELNPKLKVYVEYSNETWNTIFGQARHCKDKGRRRSEQQRYEAQLHWLRVAQVFRSLRRSWRKDRLRRRRSPRANPRSWTGRAPPRAPTDAMPPTSATRTATRRPRTRWRT